MDCSATTPGLFPLPDWAKDRLSDLKGHQKEDLIGGDESGDIVDVYDRAREEVVAAQREAGLTTVVEGQLRWDDMLAHPLCVHENVSTGGIVRYYDNNNFYRDPVVEGELTFDGDVAGELDAAADHADSLQAVLPGPYSLADLATDAHYGDEAEFLAAVAEFLGGEVEAFPDAVDRLFLLDPSLVEHAPDAEFVDRVGAALDTVAAATDAEVVVHSYWGALPEHVHATLLDADVDGIGYDLVAGGEAAFDAAAEYGTTETVALGVADGQNTRVESAATIAERADEFADRASTDVGTAYLTTNTELFYLPVSQADEKLAALGEATRLAEVNA